MSAKAAKKRRVQTKQDKIREGFAHLRTHGVLAHQKRFGYSAKLSKRLMREMRFLTDPTKASPTCQSYWQECQQRMLWMMEGDQFRDELTFNDEAVQSFEDLPTHVEYDRNKLPPLFGQSVQRHGNCFMNGPAVLQHHLVNRYLVQKGKEATEQSLNMLHWLRDHTDARSLDAYVFNGSGGNAYTTLDNILLPNSVVSFFEYSISESLELYGPGLVVFNRVPEDFMDVTVHQHFGRSIAPRYGFQSMTGGSEGHALVVIGSRRERGGREIFLLQNWWPHKQFVEVDEEYLQSCGAQVWFVETPQTHTRPELADIVNSGVLRVTHDVYSAASRQQ